MRELIAILALLYSTGLALCDDVDLQKLAQPGNNVLTREPRLMDEN